MKSVLFIGAINEGNIAVGGQESKNQIILDFLLKNFKTARIDTKKWRSNPFIVFKIALNILKKYDLVLISTASISAFRLISILRVIGKTPHTIYMVVGGWFPTMLKSNTSRVSVYKDLKAIYCEGHKMVTELFSLGLNNAKYMPNFKIIDEKLLNFYSTTFEEEAKVKFLYLSRIDTDKGAKLVLEAFERIYKENNCTNIQLDFYGVVHPDFETYFFSMLSKLPFARYYGVIDMRVEYNFKKLINEHYRAMLFCTTYYGEGFPGVLIDAMILGIPVIATDWSLNREIIEDGVSGLIIEPNNIKQLEKAIGFFIDHPSEALKMSEYIHSKAHFYSVEHILGELCQ